MYRLPIALALLVPLAAAAEGLPRRVPCSPDLAKLEQLTSERFDDAWPLCRLYGNFDPTAKASRSDDELATVDLSKDFEEGGAPRHVLVVCRQQTVDGEVERSHGSHGSSDVFVYGRDATGWTLLRANREAEQGGSFGSCARTEWVMAGPKRPALLMGGGGTWQGFTMGWDRLFSLTGDSIRRISPSIRLESDPACDLTAEEGGGTGKCSSLETTYALKPGKNPDWHDLILELDRSQRLEEGGPIKGTREVQRHVFRLWHFVRVDPAPLGKVSVWSGTVGGTPMRLALVQEDPERKDVIGYFRSADAGALVVGNLEERLDEFDGGRLSGVFDGDLKDDVFRGQWHRPLARGGVPFSFSRLKPASGGWRPGRYEAAGATLVLADAGKGKVGIAGAGPQAKAGITLTGTFPIAKNAVAYVGKDCKLKLELLGDVVAVRQLTPSCGDAGLTFDSEDVGPFVRVGE